MKRKYKRQKKKEKILIFGTGAFAQVAYVYFMKDSPYEVVAFTVHSEHVKEKQLFNLPIIPFEEVEELYPPEKYKMFVAVGYRNLNKLRAKIYNEAKEKDYELVTYINSKAIHWGEIEIGDNCFIFENNVIQPFVKIGNDVIIWSGNHIGHHSVIGDHCFITSHAVISGFSRIGDYCFIGVNATIIDGIKITSECIIGAGALVVKDIEKSGVYIGQPAKFYREIREDEFGD